MTHISAVRFHAVSGRLVFFAKSANCLLTSTSHWTKCHLHSPPVVYKFSPASGYLSSFNPPLPVPFSPPHTHTHSHTHSRHSLYCIPFDPSFPRSLHFFFSQSLCVIHTSYVLSPCNIFPTAAKHYTVWHLIHPPLEPFTSSPPSRRIIHAS